MGLRPTTRARTTIKKIILKNDRKFCHRPLNGLTVTVELLFPPKSEHLGQRPPSPWEPMPLPQNLAESSRQKVTDNQRPTGATALPKAVLLRAQKPTGISADLDPEPP